MSQVQHVPLWSLAESLVCFGSKADMSRRANSITRGACFKFGQGAWLFHWHAVEGADGEDYRANSVRAPFSDISARRAPFALENPRLSSLRKFALLLTL
jgi:hypothetical protein